MLKKALPLVLMSGFALAACNNDETPNNNETPMENVEDRVRDWTPDMDNRQTGPDMDGLDNDRTNEGIIRDDRVGNDMEGPGTGTNGMDQDMNGTGKDMNNRKDENMNNDRNNR